MTIMRWNGFDSRGWETEPWLVRKEEGVREERRKEKKERKGKEGKGETRGGWIDRRRVR